MTKIDINGPMSAAALTLAHELILQRFGPLNPSDSPEAIANRMQTIGKAAEALIRSFVVAIEESPMSKPNS